MIQFAPGLPKTRSGKIMRRILRKIAEGDTSNLGDISTLADPSRGRRSGQERARNSVCVFLYMLAAMGVAYWAKLDGRNPAVWFAASRGADAAWAAASH